MPSPCALAVSEMSKETEKQKHRSRAAQRKEAEKIAGDKLHSAAADLKEAQDRGGKLARELAGARKHAEVEAKAQAKAAAKEAKESNKEDQIIKEAIIVRRGEERRQVHLHISDAYAHV